ncbi:tyrosine-type recombinase/integrase, partial [Actinomadura kijaniata]|uniref:tyrosine-type recombinase/integrase n=1 Tax=Actinomadura kijaniata TaxID=46161 RepID=UPI003F1CC929
APRTLTVHQRKRFLRAVEHRPLARDRAIGRLLLYSGVHVSELVALDVDDVPTSSRTGAVRVRASRDELAREVPLTDPTTRDAITEWKADRVHWNGASTPALFLNRRGGRLSTRAVDHLLDEIAIEAGLVDQHGNPTVSAHVLRHTFATTLLRAGVDIAIVAELLGHARLDTPELLTALTAAASAAAPEAC